MEILDRVFTTIFARFRRRIIDPNPYVAWRRASNRVCLYLALPSAAIILTLFVTVGALTGRTAVAIDKRSAQVVAGLLGLAVVLLLDRRFKKYLSLPPALPPNEATQDTRLLMWFRTVTIGVFLLSGLIAYLLHGVRYS